MIGVTEVMEGSVAVVVAACGGAFCAVGAGRPFVLSAFVVAVVVVGVVVVVVSVAVVYIGVVVAGVVVALYGL